MHRTQNVAISSVTRALNLVGDRWNQLIVQEVFRGAGGFEDLLSGTGATRNTLSTRLRGLVANGVLEQRAQRQGGARKNYHLTEKGEDLFSWILLVWSWGIRWQSVASNGPTVLSHTTCGKAMLPVPVCGHCHGRISVHNCRYETGEGAGDEEIKVPRLHQRRRKGGDEVQRDLDVVDMTADRWTGMVLSTQYFGLHKFDEMLQHLNIASNILSDRLRALVSNGVFERRIYAMTPPRYDYWMTSKGKDLYPQALTLLQWGDRWLAPDGPPVIVIHKQCEQPVETRLVCSECDGDLTHDNVVEKRGRDRIKPKD